MFASCVRIVIALAIAGVVTFTVRQSAGAQDANADRFRDGLSSLANAFGSVATVEGFTQSVPMSRLDPNGPDGLRTGALLADVFGALPPTFTSVIHLEDSLEGLDGDYGGVAVVLGCPEPETPGCAQVRLSTVETGGAVSRVEAEIPIRATRSVKTPVHLSTEVVDVDGGDLNVVLALSTTLELRLDTTRVAGDPADPDLGVAFALVDAPTVVVNAQLPPSDVSADGSLGFTEVTAALQRFGATLDVAVQVADPDSSGDVTLHEITTTAPEDLFQVTPCATAAGTLALDSDLVPGAPDVIQPFSSKECTFTTPSFTDVELDALLPFTRMTPDAALNGLGQFATAMGGAHALKDTRLPFVAGKLSDAVRAFQPVMDFVNRQAVSCALESGGSTPGDVYTYLDKDTVVLCQAFSNVRPTPGSVHWLTGTNAVCAPDPEPCDAEATVVTLDPGPATGGGPPPHFARFRMSEAGYFRAAVMFTHRVTRPDGSGLDVDRLVEQPARTAQELFARLVQSGLATGGAPAYDPRMRALRFPLKHTFSPGEATAGYDFGDLLEQGTGLIGLHAASDAKVAIRAEDASFDVTFGLLLVDDLEQIGRGQPCPRLMPPPAGGCPRDEIDRVFVQVRPDAPEVAVNDASITAQPPTLEGQLGFLGVTALGALDDQGTALTFRKRVPTAPLFRVDVEIGPDQALHVGDETLPDAVGLRWLMSGISDYASRPQLNLRADGKLKVTAAASGVMLGEGIVTLEWPDVTAGPPTVTPDGSFSTQLQPFDIEPNLFGSHTGGDDADDLVDASRTFVETDVVGQILENITDGSYCEVAQVVLGGHGLRCKQGSRTVEEPDPNDPSRTITRIEPIFLGGGTDNHWDAGDVYRLRVGDPLALLWDLLDNIDTLAGKVDGVAGTGLAAAYANPLPFVAVSAKELVHQFQMIRRAAAELRGAPGPTISCGVALHDGVPAGGIIDKATDRKIYCRVNHAKPATKVAWIATADATVAANGDATSTVGSPAALSAVPMAPESVTLEVEPDRQHAFRVTAEFDDDTGPNRVEYPDPGIASTLQALERAIEQKLGSGFDLTLAIDTSTGTRRLQTGLEYRRCSDAALCADDSDFVVNAEPVRRSLVAHVGAKAGTLVGLNTDGQLAVHYDAVANVAMAFPFEADGQITVLPSSRVELRARVDNDQLSLNASLGGLTLVAGTGAKLVDGAPAGDGVLRLGAQVSLEVPAGSPEMSPDAFVSALRADLGQLEGGGVACGDGDLVGDGTSDPKPLAGLACGKLSLGGGLAASPTHFGDVCFVAKDNGTFETCEIPDASLLLKQLEESLLDWDLLDEPLPKLLERLETGLRATAYAGSNEAAGGKRLPLVGDALDAGADVVKDVRMQVVDKICANDGALCGALKSLPLDATAKDVEDTVRRVSHKELTRSPGGQPGDPVDGILRTWAWSPADDPDQVVPGDSPTEADVKVITHCGPADAMRRCNIVGPMLDKASDISEIRVSFKIGRESRANTLPFDLGLDGVPLRVAGGVFAKAGWSLVVDFGISRSLGPYLGYDGGDAAFGADYADPSAHLKVRAYAGLAEDTAPQTVCNSEVADPAGDLAFVGFTASERRCLAGRLGFLAVNVRDRDGPDAAQRTHVRIGTQFKYADASAPDERLTLAEILSLQISPSLALDVDAAIHLRFRTGMPDKQNIGFPTIVGTFSATWDWQVPGGQIKAPEVSFGRLYLDLGFLRTGFIGPILEEVRRLTGPFMPVIDLITAPLPVISDVSEWVGGDPITMLSLLESATGADLTFIKSLAELIRFANRLASAEGYIALGGGPDEPGSFDIKGDALFDARGPGEVASIIDGGTVNAALGNLFARPASGTPSPSNPFQSTYDDPVSADLPGTFGVPGLTFPFMENAGQVFGLLLGQDATLVRYDTGILSGKISFTQDFGPIMIGPVPLTVGVGAAIGVEGRFAIGYDTSGLRQVLQGGSGTYLFDGIFIDDLDARGNDVMEIGVFGEVFARAGVSILIASAGVEGGARLTLGLNLNDAPQRDGKLRIEEIGWKLRQPLCLFNVEGKVTAFLRAYVEALFVARATWEFLNVTLVDFETDFAKSCDPAGQPVLAELMGDGALKLNMGPRAHLRNIAEDEPNEQFTVRPVGTGKYAVSAFGITQVYPGLGTPNVPVTSVEADGGGGNDSILLLDGANEEDRSEPLAFTASAVLHGGSDDDVLTGGADADALYGDDGDDKLNGRDGDDRLWGGVGSDSLTGDAGVDTLYGGSENDTLSGGNGGDTLFGGDGADVLTGGPEGDGGNDPARIVDVADTIFGNAGDDVIDGGPGADKLYGDDGLSCVDDGDAGGAVGADRIDGGPGDDDLFGGGGDDVIAGADGDDHACGNGGGDRIDGDTAQAVAPTLFTGVDFLHGGVGADTLRGFGGNDVLRGADGDDTLDGGDGEDDLVGGMGADTLDGSAGRDILLGDEGAILGSGWAGPARHVATAREMAYIVTPAQPGDGDQIHGGPDADAIFGEGGADHLYGDAASDWMLGGAGDDLMRGGGDADAMFGERGADTMFGDSGHDRMLGNEDGDTMFGGIGLDDAEGNQGPDTMFGDADQDNLIGGTSDGLTADGDDTIHGNGQADFIAGDNALIERLGSTRDDDPSADDRRVTILNVDSTVATRFGADTLFGDDANDFIWGQGGDDVMSGGDGIDRAEGNGGGDTVHGDTGNDLIAGGSTDNAILLVEGAALASDRPSPAITRPRLTRSHAWTSTVYLAIVVRFHGRHGTVFDHFEAGDGGDTLFGDAGEDVVLGDNGRLPAHGVPEMRLTDPGTFGDDWISGGPADDRAYGQLGADEMYGDGEGDYLLGDLGEIAPPTGGPGRWPGGAPNRAVRLIEPDEGGDDVMHGGSGDDHVYGGAGADNVSGGPADDHIEGNGGSDRLFGTSLTFEDGATAAEIDAVRAEGDEDDIIGGSSSVHPGVAQGAADGGEALMQGNEDADVMIGDNGEIDRSVAGAAWHLDPLTADVQRAVVLHDLQRSDATAPRISDVSGGDRIEGSGGRDRLFGQGGMDCMKGDDDAPDTFGTHDDDYLEGNHDSDWIAGNASDDDLIGGNPRLAGPPDRGYPDAADFMIGGTGADVMLGDNGVISRTTGAPIPGMTGIERVGMRVPRQVRMLDLADPPPPANFGDDQMSGYPGPDVMFGQDGGDAISGGSGDDYVEGNGGRDWIFGDRPLSDVADGSPKQRTSFLPGLPPALAECGFEAPDDQPHGQDDLLGGSAIEGHRDDGDWIYGDGAADFGLGDNGRLVRTITNGADEIEVERYPIGDPPPDARVKRIAVRFDVNAWPFNVPDDYLEGNDGDDALWGENGDDVIWGNVGDDDLYGELGDDALYGGADRDVLIGDRGSSAARLVDGSQGDPSALTARVQLPNNVPVLELAFFRQGALDRRVDLIRDGDGTLLLRNGIVDGGDDRLRGGRGADALHGGAGDDLMNGDSDGDALYGGPGSDVMWGGRGDESSQEPDARGVNDAWVDFLFGGEPGRQSGGLGSRPDGADLLDYAPRPQDPEPWKAMTGPYDDGQGAPEEDLDQHHHGVDLIYGGKGRDVLQSNVPDRGGIVGDRIVDWFGDFNLYSHCATTGRQATEVRIRDNDRVGTDLIRFIREVAYGTGIGDSLSAVATTSTSAHRELALVEDGDRRDNSGAPFPSSPGSFENDTSSCRR